jgi:hypothetical protein
MVAGCRLQVAVGSGHGEMARHFLQTGRSCFYLTIFALRWSSWLRSANNSFVTAAHRDDAVLAAEIAKFSQAGILRNLSLLTQDFRNVVSADVVHKFECDLLLDLANNFASFADFPDDRDGREAWLKEKQVRLIMQLLDKELLGKFLASLEKMPKLASGEVAAGVDSFAEYLDFHLSQLKAQPQTGRVLDKEKLLNGNLDDALQRQQLLRRTYRNDLPLELSLIIMTSYLWVNVCFEMVENEEKPTAVYAKKVHKGGFDEVNRLKYGWTLSGTLGALAP